MSSAQQDPLFMLSQEETARRTKQADSIESIYVSHARIAAGFLDVRIFFGEQSVTPTGVPTFTEEVCLVMTPEFAKILSGLLASQLAGYEKIFGIRTPPQQTPELMQQIEKLQRDLQK